MSAAPRASVIINNYNYARYLGEAIESALAQSYQPTEVIVVDDGSTDESRDVIAGYGTRVRSVFKENGGQGSTYNAGFGVCSGDIVCYLDADDTLFPGAMAEVARLMSDPQVVKVQWPCAITDAHGIRTGELSTKRPPPEGDYSALVIRDGPLYDAFLHTGNAYARTMLQRIFPMPEFPYRNGADVYLVTTAPVLGLVRTAASPLGTYRVHGANNFRGRELDDDRLRNYIGRFETNCDALARVLRQTGRTADVDGWKRRNFNYLWPTRALRARADLATHLPDGARYILIDGNEWGGGQFVPGRTAIPFLERAGEYFGPPADDDTAIQELQRMGVERTATFLALWWTSFWWRDEYPRFMQHLAATYHCLVDGDHLTLFDLRA
jgi:glycosyltransferase involved in cell wall biosynthesis